MVISRGEKKKKLKKIAKRVAKCAKCPFQEGATNPVPGVGNPGAEVVFIGEAPGYHEDQQGLPFVGAAGRLLDRLLSSIELRREDVWIGNILKHRPPGNRDPQPKEVEACTPYLDEQIKVIDPKVIVTLGRFAMSKFLPGEKISRIHGQARYVNFAGKKRIVFPLYHPAAALRRGSVMEQIKKDFVKIPQFLSGERKEAIPSAQKSEDSKEQQMELF